MVTFVVLRIGLQSFMPLNASLISFIEAKGLGLVIIILVSSAKKK